MNECFQGTFHLISLMKIGVTISNLIYSTISDSKHHDQNSFRSVLSIEYKVHHRVTNKRKLIIKIIDSFSFCINSSKKEEIFVNRIAKYQSDHPGNEMNKLISIIIIFL